MQHSFDIEIAQRYGVPVAIFLNNLAFWIKKNQANRKHFHDGRYWTYNSSEALSILFPYWSTDQIDRLIKKCTKLGLLLKGNYNKSSYDRTRWFGLTDLGLELMCLAIPPNRGIGGAESRNENRQIAEPIPDNKPDTNTDRERGAVDKSSKPSSIQASNKRLPLSNFIPDQACELLCRSFGLDLNRELESFNNRHQREKTQYEFRRWLEQSNEYIRRKSIKESMSDIKTEQREGGRYGHLPDFTGKGATYS